MLDTAAREFRSLLTGDAFNFQWIVFLAAVLASLGYAFVGRASASAVAEVNQAVKPCIDLLGALGLPIDRPPMDGALPKEAYRVMTGLQIWAAIAYGVALAARLALTRRPLSVSRTRVIERLMTEYKLPRLRAEVVLRLLYALLVVLGAFFSWCLLNGLNGYFVFHVDTYGVLPIPALVFVLPGALALPTWLGLAENLARDAALLCRWLLR